MGMTIKRIRELADEMAWCIFDNQLTGEEAGQYLLCSLLDEMYPGSPTTAREGRKYMRMAEAMTPIVRQGDVRGRYAPPWSTNH